MSQTNAAEALRNVEIPRRRSKVKRKISWESAVDGASMGLVDLSRTIRGGKAMFTEAIRNDDFKKFAQAEIYGTVVLGVVLGILTGMPIAGVLGGLMAFGINMCLIKVIAIAVEQQRKERGQQ